MGTYSNPHIILQASSIVKTFPVIRRYEIDVAHLLHARKKQNSGQQIMIYFLDLEINLFWQSDLIGHISMQNAQPTQYTGSLPDFKDWNAGKFPCQDSTPG